MPSAQKKRLIAFVFMVLAISGFCCSRCHAHAVLLLEEPYGFFGTVFPVGHSAIYFENVCAQTPIKLRRCGDGELGAVITRNPGIGGYDWVAIPLIPYLYSVENVSEIPAKADSLFVWKVRRHYHEAHLLTLGDHLNTGNFVRGGWALVIGMAYERKIYAFSFETTSIQDDALIARMNAGKNRTHFEFMYNNCSDFARFILSMYFPGCFKREIFRDAGMTSPKMVARTLVCFARRHPEMRLAVYEIPQVPGYRRRSRRNKGLTESLVTTPYVFPVAAVSPYLAGGLLLDYLLRGRIDLIPEHPQVVAPDNLSSLTDLPRLALDSSRSESLVNSSEVNNKIESPFETPRLEDSRNTVTPPI